ncbi:winged helix-turn-helix transcriptional regulator [Nonomuraea sp. B1E8]|uniref:winged helix-turn-helix transcriptional regulator n=1 Tax=unclassified Nonomuraea TaxID=2593643 RepID=UPI00325D41C8
MRPLGTGRPCTARSRVSLPRDAAGRAALVCERARPAWEALLALPKVAHAEVLEVRPVGPLSGTRAILYAGARGAHRFGEYRRMVAGISDRMLTVRRRELEAHKLIRRDVVPSMPVQVLYHLTERGRFLIEAVHGVAHLGGAREPVSRGLQRTAQDDQAIVGTEQGPMPVDRFRCC